MIPSDPRVARPLSPHLQIFRPILTMVMSIAHRITGGALYFGMLIPAVWLVGAASGAEWYDAINRVFASLPGRVVLFGFTWALMHHMLGGIRHLVWDVGYGFEIRSAQWMARATLVGSIGLTALIWLGAWGIGVL